MARISCTGQWPMLRWHAPLNWPPDSCWMSAPGPERSPVGSAAGAHVVAVDASWPILAHQAPSRPPAVVGDISRLPLVEGAVDGAAAAFVLNHLADPGAALVEARRVVRPGGFIVASVFSIADPSAASLRNV